jgi:hypothetical protein
MKNNADGPDVSSTRLLDDLWSFLCDCENAGDRTRRTALRLENIHHGEGEYQLAREVKHRMVILGYKPSSNASGEGRPHAAGKDG